ncbi:MAG: NAD(P)H-hydrate dehydratase [Patescibacteria group bacterium]
MVHKGDNGILYIVAGSKQYHGALWYAVMAAEPLVDLIYVDTDTSNKSLVNSLKQLHSSIILVPPRQRATYLNKSDAVLLGPGLGRNSLARNLVNKIMLHPQRPAKVVIDADGLWFLQKKWLDSNMILTPHPGEYKRLFGRLTPAAAARTVPAVILAKGVRTAICQNGNCEYNTGGIVHLTKGGIGDVLAGVVAGLACTQPPYQATQLASQLVAKAEQIIYRRYNRFATTSQLLEQLPLTYKKYFSHESQSHR